MLNDDIEPILDFALKHLRYTDRDLLRDYINEHNKYGTIDYAIDDKGNIIAMCRWNMSVDGDVAIILDFCIDKEWRNKGFCKNFILRAMEKFPKIEKLQFIRGVRGDFRIRLLSIKKILNSNIF